jgi:hypothetical protein
MMKSYQEAYADYLRERVSEGLDLHPDGCIAFVAGWKAAREAIIDAFKDNTCDYCAHEGCQNNVEAIALIEAESK